MIMKTAVEQIKERLTIFDVVGAYVELQKAGKHFKGKSPFTNEKTPSFFVSPDRGMFYCFSSQKGGDMFTFIQEMEGVDFKGALKILAEKAHVELIPEDPKSRNERDTQYALIEEATQFFFKKREEHEHVETYIAERGVKAGTVHTWRIGYAPDEWRSLKAHLKDKGYSEEVMLKAGLIKKTDSNKESYDVFRDRVMFPIADSSGRIVAFSGRTLKNEEGVPKYVNSPETELFQKSEILYGYDKAKQGIRHYDFSLIVEGQFDLVLSHQAGYHNAVAVSGTALTAHHLMLLSRLSNRAVLALDSDRAGIAAVKRGAALMLKQGMDVKVARMEGGKDPADIIKADPQRFKQMIGGATHVVEFLLSVLKEGAKDDRSYKLHVREDILPLITVMENHIDREHFEAIIAEAIGTTKDAIHYEVGRIESAREHTEAPAPIPKDPIAASNPILTRKHSVLVHLLALTDVAREENEWLRNAISPHPRFAFWRRCTNSFQ
jgi:DNA primase